MYYNSGDLPNAEIHTQAVQKNLLTLVNNDDNNYSFKESLLDSYLLSIRIFINHNKSDQALIYLDKSKVLINRLKSTESKTTDLIAININLLQYQAQAMALLKQNQSALVAITDAMVLFKQHLSIKTHTTFYARLLLTKWNIVNAIQNMDNIAIKKELIEIKVLLESKLQRSKPNYKTLSIYLAILSSIQQYSPDNPWLKIYQHSDYNIPEYSISNVK